MSKHLRRSIEHSFRCKVWFGFFLVCAAVFFFPPWIISEDASYPAPFRIYWLTHWDFHFLAYKPPYGWLTLNAYGPDGCEEIRYIYSSYKHLNYYLLGIEVACLGVLAAVLHLVIRRHAGSKAYNTHA